ALRPHHGRRLGEAAVAAVPPGHAQAAAQGPRRQEPAADRLRAAGRPGAAGAGAGLHRGRLRARGRRGAARGGGGQHPGGAGGTRLPQRRRLAGGRADRPRSRRRRRRGHGRPDHAPAGGLPGRPGRGLRRGGGGPADAGHLRRRADLSAHRLRLPAARRPAAHPPGGAGRRRVQGEAGPADGAGLPRVRGLLVERRHVRLAGLDAAGAAGAAAPRHPRPGHRAGRGAGTAGRDLPPAAQDQRRLRGDGARQPGPGLGARGGRPAADHLARRRRLRLALGAAAPRRAGERDPGRQRPGGRARQPRHQPGRGRPAGGGGRPDGHGHRADAPDHPRLPGRRGRADQGAGGRGHRTAGARLRV
ncbi:MAG: Mannose-1-phosphate guanylyltransferase, partial [uncultured Friedmanniella sp.]